MSTLQDFLSVSLLLTNGRRLFCCMPFLLSPKLIEVSDTRIQRVHENKRSEPSETTQGYSLRILIILTGSWTLTKPHNNKGLARLKHLIEESGVN